MIDESMTPARTDSAVAEQPERSLPGQIAELGRQSVDLLRKELQLFKLELGEKLEQLQHGAKMLAVGSLILAGGVLTLLAAIVLGIGVFIPYWASALIVGGVVTVIGIATLGKGGYAVRIEHLQPERTIEELERDKRLVEEHV